MFTKLISLNPLLLYLLKNINHVAGKSQNLTVFKSRVVNNETEIKLNNKNNLQATFKNHFSFLNTTPGELILNLLKTDLDEDNII